MTASASNAAVQHVREARRGRNRRQRVVVGALSLLVVAALSLNIMVGQTIYSPADVLAVVTGGHSANGAFVIGSLRLPRASLALVVGLSFGLAGVTFQTLLRNPLASPDIIGITEAASAAAAVAIVSFGLSGLSVSVLAVTAGMAVAVVIYALAHRRGVAGTRLILIGIGVAAMMQSVIAWQLEKATTFQIAETLRWLTGSLNGATQTDTIAVLIALVVLGSLILVFSRDLSTSRLGNDAAAALGIHVERMRLILFIAAITLVCVATAAAGPVAFLAFLPGPIATRLLAGCGSALVPAALVGALLALVADFCGQYAFSARLPVGVVTGILGAPYLVYLIIRVNKHGGTP